MDHRAQASESTGTMLFSDEMVKNSPFFKDVVGLRFGDGAGDASHAEVYKVPQEVLDVYAQLPELVHLIHASDFVGASGSWIKEKARSIGAELKVPLKGTQKEVISYHKETLLELYVEFHSVPMQTTELTLSELEQRTGMRREVLAIKLPQLGAVTLKRRSILNNREATFYDESTEDVVNQYIESLPIAPEGWKTAPAVGALLGMGEARATRLLAPFQSETQDMLSSNHIVSPHYPPHAIEHATKHAEVEQEVPYATEEDIALKALAAAMGKHQSWVTKRLPYVEVSTIEKRNPVNNRVFPYLTPNPRRALEALPEDILKLNPNKIPSEAKRQQQRDKLSIMTLRLDDQQKLIRTLRIKLDRLKPAEETQKQVKVRADGHLSARVSLPMTGKSEKDENPLAWQSDASCAQTDPEAFFPEKGGSTRAAKKICTTCDAQERCLVYAIKNDERFGIWGGLSEHERRQLRKHHAVNG